jgi:pyruvate dehydrogenase E1 component alpha subunit
VFAELMGRADGYCAGRGGSQHLCALDQGFLGTNGITGGGLPIAVGAALAVQYRHEHDRVVVVFFGDGAANQGAFHESLNMASLWNLRVLFVCENNGYGMSTPVDQSTAGGGVARRATAYNMEGRTVEGIGLMEVKAASAESLEFVRGGSRPFLLELMTYRHCGHSKNDARVYRTREEEEAWKQKDCLGVTRAELERLGVSTHDLDTVEQQALERVQKDADAALALPCGSENDALGGVYA